MKAVKCSLAVLGLSAAMMISGPVQAAALNFLSETAAGRMTDEDFTAMTNAALEALNDPVTPSMKVWTNPKSGAGGTLKTTREFTAKTGEPCKLVEHKTQAKKLTHEAVSTVCKMKDGWKLVSDDFAAPPAEKK